MASTGSNLLLLNLSLPLPPRVTSAHVNDAPKLSSNSQAKVLFSRRQSLFLLTATTALTAVDFSAAKAEDIPLFGLRKKLKKVEEEAVEIIKEGAETAERVVIEAAERGVETAGKEIETTAAAAASFSFGGEVGGLTQAGVVIGAEAVGVLVATSIVNGILGPESQKSS